MQQLSAQHSSLVNQLVMVLFALNGKYLLNDKTALSEVAQFERCPAGFVPRIQQTLATHGSSVTELGMAVASIAQLLRETCELAHGLYQPRYPSMLQSVQRAP